MEIYNEEYKDLLGKTLPAGKKHQVRCCHSPPPTPPPAEFCFLKLPL